jgi:hypothetical protein
MPDSAAGIQPAADFTELERSYEIHRDLVGIIGEPGIKLGISGEHFTLDHIESELQASYGSHAPYLAVLLAKIDERQGPHMAVTCKGHRIPAPDLQLGHIHVPHNVIHQRKVECAVVLREGNVEFTLAGIVYRGVDLAAGICVKICAPVVSFPGITGELHRVEAVTGEPGIHMLPNLEDLLVYLLGIAGKGSVIDFLPVQPGGIQLDDGLGDIGVDDAPFVVDGEHQFLASLESELILVEIDGDALLPIHRDSGG